MTADTYYEVLGVNADASQDEVKAAYRRLSRQVHPDQGGSGALFREVTEAYKALSDPVRRVAYDRSLRTPPGWTALDEPAEDAPGWVRTDATPDGDFGSDGSVRGQGGQAVVHSKVGQLFAKHPAGFLVGLGFLVASLGGSLSSGGVSLAPLGFLLLIVGFIALVGGRRVLRGDQYSPRGLSGGALLWEELRAGFAMTARRLVSRFSAWSPCPRSWVRAHVRALVRVGAARWSRDETARSFW